MAVKACLTIFMLALLLLTGIPASLIPSAVAARDAVSKSPLVPLLGEKGKSADEKGRPHTAHHRPSTHKQAASRFARIALDDYAPPTPIPSYGYGSPNPSPAGYVPSADPCSTTSCGPPVK